MSWNRWIFIAGLFALTSIALGAFGAHALKKILSPEVLEVFQTAVKYQMFQVCGFISVGFLRKFSTDSLINKAGYLFLYGTLIFSGSLYLLCFTGIKWLGAITPIGGVCLIIGWIMLSIGAYRVKSTN
jgi:uncharacterized membrane protein YgdD (TMEM256/DUF423 family)